MSLKLLQFDFPFDGPWHEELGLALRPLAREIAAEDGLVWKIWTENAPARRARGVYLFRDVPSAERYRAKHLARLEGFGIKDAHVGLFDVNDVLSALTRAPL